MESEEERFSIVLNLYKNHWTLDLLSELMFKDTLKQLEPREFFVLEEKIKGISNKELAELLKIKDATVARIINRIKIKYKDRFERRVDNVLYQFQRQNWKGVKKTNEDPEQVADSVDAPKEDVD